MISEDKILSIIEEFTFYSMQIDKRMKFELICRDPWDYVSLIMLVNSQLHTNISTEEKSFFDFNFIDDFVKYIVSNFK